MWWNKKKKERNEFEEIAREEREAEREYEAIEKIAQELTWREIDEDSYSLFKLPKNW